jgi:pyruvate dehydrogenase E2 component (dihydrolipoamide acetyltransferase)
MIEVRLPSLGADMDQGTLLEWRVRPGDDVKKGDVIAVVDTVKAALDVECWHSGKLLDLQIVPGQTIPVGTLMARLLEPGEDPAKVPPPASPAAPPARSGAAPAAAPVAAPAAPAARVPPPRARHSISPAARRRAGELGVSVGELHGSGPHGAITLKDVEEAALRKAPARDRSAEIRRTIAGAMTRSKREIPHYYLSDDVPLGAASEWLRRTNADRPVTERILLPALYVRALALAAQRHRDLNGLFIAGEFRPSPTVNVGMAISLRGGGVIAPAIHATEQKSIAEIMQALGDLVARSRAGSLRRDELADPTITLTNLGDQSVTSVQGVIYAPQVALIGFGVVRERAWVVDGRIVATPVVTVTLAADHRVSDGHAGARFLADLASRLQRPEQL